MRGSLNFSTQIQVEYDNPGCEGNARSPMPIPPMTLLSWEANELTPTTETEWALVGAMLGKKMQPKPSDDISSSMNGGKMELFCVCTSLGVVMDTIVLIRVKGTILPESRLCSS